MSSSSQQRSAKPSHGGKSMAKQDMLDQYINADATIVERISGAAKGGESSTARYRNHVSKAKNAIDKFDKAWGGK
ncbi:hypothetical protein F4803DRAFT_573336 [Xylaria telfairii]|nr:hypothetical protein F4803DRAFT_573336 [Xylaria telfairii]